MFAKLNFNAAIHNCLLALLLLLELVAQSEGYHILRTEELEQRPKRQSDLECGIWQFTCANLEKCIDRLQRCDGKVDCFDSSDETGEFCGNEESPGSCRVPDTPNSIVRRYYDDEWGSAIPGTYISDGFHLRYMCKTGFAVPESTSSSILHYCDNGTIKEVDWPAKCVPLCPMPVSKKVMFTCKRDDDAILCDEYFRPGTGIVVTMECKDNHRRTDPSASDTATCMEGGRWDIDVIDCVPTCGYLNQSYPLVLNGSGTSIEQYPWHVSIDRRGYEGKSDYKCGGTIIDAATIVTAASCVTSMASSITLPAADIMVAAGKNYEDLDDVLDSQTAQTRQVKKILRHPEYNGWDTSADIALLRVDDFDLNQYVAAACIDWSSKDEIGDMGTVAASKSYYDPNITIVQVPIISREECLRKAPEADKYDITPDKFCSELSFNGSCFSTRKGSGLITENADNLFTLTGITSPWKIYINYNSTCQFLQLYTKISEHINFIKSRSWNPPPGGCKIPDPPSNSTVRIFGQKSDATSGTYVGNGITLEYKCKQGFILADSNSVGVYHPCINGQLQDQQTVKCLPTCSIPKAKTVEFSCKSDNSTFPCDRPVRPGTVMTMECKDHYRRGLGVLDISTCKDGKWDTPVINCTATCGLHSKAKPLIIHGSNTQFQLHPWHVAIYRKKNAGYEYICGGTLVDVAVVISAAHCLTHVQTYATLPSENYIVAAGKNYRDLEDERDNTTKQIRQVKEILVHPFYRGYTHSYMADIALIRVDDFNLNNNVGTICLGWKSKEKDTIEDVATVVGWGVTRLDGKFGDSHLKKLEVPIIPYEECEKKAPRDFQAFVTRDKYCAGYFNGSSVCTGDSGGGLITKDPDDYYVLRGIVSAAPFKDGSCDNDQLATYTKISHYLDFIREANKWIN